MTQGERIDDADSRPPGEGPSEGVGAAQPIDPSRRRERPTDATAPPPGPAPEPDRLAPRPRRPPSPPARPPSSPSRPTARRSRTVVGAVDRVRRTDFPVALRGYERAAVDAYVADVAQLVAELEATQLPETVVERALDDVGEQTSAILKRAHEAAEEIAARSRSHAEGRLDRAEREAELTRREAEDHVRRIEADVQSIWQERQRLIDDIRQLADDVLALADDAIDRIPAPATNDDRAQAPGSMPSEVEQTQALGRDDLGGELEPEELPGREPEQPPEPPPASERSTESGVDAQPALDAEPLPQPRPGGQSPEDEDTAERPAGA